MAAWLDVLFDTELRGSLLCACGIQLGLVTPAIEFQQRIPGDEPLAIRERQLDSPGHQFRAEDGFRS